MNKGRIITRLVLAILVTLSAVGVVYAKHQNRKLFVELQSLNVAMDKMNIEWGQLKLEESTWSSNGRIDQLARTRLGMYIPMADAVVVVKQQ